MKWRSFIDDGGLYYGLAFVNWLLLPHVYLNLIELVLSHYREPDIRKVVPSWNYIMVLVTFSYGALISYIRSRYKDNVADTNMAIVFAVLGCLFIPTCVGEIFKSVGRDGSLDDMGLRILVGGAIPAQICIMISAVTVWSLLLKKLQSRALASTEMESHTPAEPEA